mgnify:CR=1 FL=1
MTQISIAVIGSCNIDVVVEAPKRPLAGETILGSRLIIAQGGKGAKPGQLPHARSAPKFIWLAASATDELRPFRN